MHKSLKFRKRNLRACVSEIKGRIEFSTEWEGKTAQDIRKRMDEILEQRGEGLVVKHPDSEYVLNGRNRDWVKVKPEYMVSTWVSWVCALLTKSDRTTWERHWMYWSLVRILRLHRLSAFTVIDNILAGNYGTGRRAGGVSTLICAVLDDRRKYEDDEDPKSVPQCDLDEATC